MNHSAELPVVCRAWSGVTDFQPCIDLQLLSLMVINNTMFIGHNDTVHGNFGGDVIFI